jgi:hypothetical protein
LTTTWKSDSKSAAHRTSNPISGTTLSPRSRQPRLATIAGLAIFGMLLACSACSEQSRKPALVGVSSPAPSPATPNPGAEPATVAASTAPANKTPKKRPANVSYIDANSGVSFLYPRKFALNSGDKTQPQLAGRATDDVPMNFVQPGGVTVAAVAVPSGSYPGTDFASAFFNVNLNRGVSEPACGQFAFVDTRNADGESVDAEKVKIGLTDMETTSNFTAGAMKQTETQYYHSYENGACYEYVLGLVTAGYGSKDGIEPVNRDRVFARLEKILSTVKINPVEQEHAAEQPATSIAAGKE